jgi:toxin ParE1/3/4
VAAELHVEAAEELSEAADWYEARREGLGERFLVEARAVVDRAASMPLSGAPWAHPEVPAGVRRMWLRSFPYSVVYVTEPWLVVVAIAHDRRRPAYWAHRLSNL